MQRTYNSCSNAAPTSQDFCHLTGHSIHVPRMIRCSRVARCLLTKRSGASLHQQHHKGAGAYKGPQTRQRSVPARCSSRMYDTLRTPAWTKNTERRLSRHPTRSRPPPSPSQHATCSPAWHGVTHVLSARRPGRAARGHNARSSPCLHRQSNATYMTPPPKHFGARVIIIPIRWTKKTTL